LETRNKCKSDGVKSVLLYYGGCRIPAFKLCQSFRCFQTCVPGAMTLQENEPKIDKICMESLFASAL